jgi:hypothetical protein
MKYGDNIFLLGGTWIKEVARFSGLAQEHLRNFPNEY